MLLPLVAFAAANAAGLRVGLTWSGDESLHYLNKEEGIDEIHRFRLSFRVTAHQTGKWLVERKVQLLGSRVMDVEIPPPAKLDPDIATQTLSEEGFVLDADPFDEGRFQADRLIEWWLPAASPETWTLDLEPKEARVKTGAAATFKLQRDVGKLRLYYLDLKSANQLDFSATGKVWFDVASGRVLTADVSAKQMKIPGGTDRATITISYTDSQTKRSPDE